MARLHLRASMNPAPIGSMRIQVHMIQCRRRFSSLLPCRMRPETPTRLIPSTREPVRSVRSTFRCRLCPPAEAGPCASMTSLPVSAHVLHDHGVANDDIGIWNVTTNRIYRRSPTNTPSWPDPHGDSAASPANKAGYGAVYHPKSRAILVFAGNSPTHGGLGTTIRKLTIPADPINGPYTWHDAPGMESRRA